MELCIPEEENLGTGSENSFGRILTTSQFISFHVIPHSLWRWETSSANLDLRGLVSLPASFWKHETMAG